MGAEGDRAGGCLHSPPVPTVQFDHLDDPFERPFDASQSGPVAHLEGWYALPTQGVVLHTVAPEHIHVEVIGRSIERIEYRFRAEGRRNRTSGQYLDV